MKLISVRFLGARVYARFRICDDSPRNLTILATESRPGKASYTRRFTTRIAPDPCGVYTRSWVPVAAPPRQGPLHGHDRSPRHVGPHERTRPEDVQPEVARRAQLVQRLRLDIDPLVAAELDGDERVAALADEGEARGCVAGAATAVPDQEAIRPSRGRS